MDSLHDHHVLAAVFFKYSGHVEFAGLIPVFPESNCVGGFLGEIQLTEDGRFIVKDNIDGVQSSGFRPESFQ